MSPSLYSRDRVLEDIGDLVTGWLIRNGAGPLKTSPAALDPTTGATTVHVRVALAIDALEDPLTKTVEGRFIVLLLLGP